MKRLTKIIFALIAIFCLCLNPLMAQKKKTSSSSKNFGIGVRAGDPTGISVKKYMGDKALELNIGKTAFWDRYDYEGYFNDDDDYKNKGYYFNGYERGSALAIQLHYLFHKDFPGLDGLQWYIGPGAQFRTVSRVYNYRYRVYWSPDPDDYFWEYGTDKVTDIGIGVDAVAGLEYTFDDLPLSLALEADLYIELFNNPLWMYPQAGLAIRYNF